MNELQSVLFGIVEYAGIIAFSISGAVIAIEEEVDYFGVMLLGLITSFGGGTLRDSLLGIFPSSNFYNYPGIFLSLITSTVVFVIAYLHREYYHIHIGKIKQINNAVDSLGLGLFAIYGVQITLETSDASNLFLVIFMGMLTGTGGGVLRDVIVRRKPVIISRYIYAVAAIVGSICYLICIYCRLSEPIAVTTGVILVFGIRMVATWKRLDFPKVKRFRGEKR